LLLCELPDEDLAFYGSANISRAALLKKPPSGNYEILIGIRFPKGEIRRRLALQQTFDSAPITADLISKKWLSDERLASNKSHIALIAVEIEESLLTVKVDATLSSEARLQLFSINQEKLMELSLRFDNQSNLYIASSRSSTRDCHFAKVISKGQESNFVAITDRASIISTCMPPLQAKYEKALNDISGGRISIDIVDIVELLADHLYSQSVSKDHVVHRGRKEDPSQEQRKPIEVDAGQARRESSKSGGYSSDIDLIRLHTLIDIFEKLQKTEFSQLNRVGKIFYVNLLSALTSKMVTNHNFEEIRCVAYREAIKCHSSQRFR